MTEKRMGRPVTTPDGNNLIARLRRKRDWNQEQTADALGISRQQVSKLERGVHPLEGAVKKLAENLLANAD